MDLLPRYATKEDFVDWKLNEFIKLKIEDLYSKNSVLVKSQQQIHPGSNQTGI